jgi:excisionase family DNA binding protein
VFDDATYITIGEASKLTGYNPEHLRRLLRSGELDGKKLSILWLVNRESLTAYIARGQKSGDKRHGPKN